MGVSLSVDSFIRNFGPGGCTAEEEEQILSEIYDKVFQPIQQTDLDSLEDDIEANNQRQVI